MLSRFHTGMGIALLVCAVGCGSSDEENTNNVNNVNNLANVDRGELSVITSLASSSTRAGVSVVVDCQVTDADGPRTDIVTEIQVDDGLELG